MCKNILHKYFAREKRELKQLAFEAEVDRILSGVAADYDSQKFFMAARDEW